MDKKRERRDTDRAEDERGGIREQAIERIGDGVMNCLYLASRLY